MSVQSNLLLVRAEAIVDDVLSNATANSPAMPSKMAELACLVVIIDSGFIYKKTVDH